MCILLHAIAAMLVNTLVCDQGSLAAVGLTSRPWVQFPVEERKGVRWMEGKARAEGKGCCH